MTVSRLLVAVPVLAGLVVTGSAVARMMPAESVRDSVYQTCAHNGVHFNKQGHANCGLHKGWSQDEPATEPGQPVGDAGTADATTAGDRGKGHAKHGHPSHPSKADHSAKTHGGKAHGGGRSAHNTHG